jgi:hypothetical protein
MNLQERTGLVYRIISGRLKCKINNIVYFIFNPSIEVLNDAQDIYTTFIDDNKYDYFSKKNCEPLLIYNGLWKNEYNNQLKQLEEDVENCKVDIYKSFFNTTQYSRLKEDLSILYTEINRLEGIKCSLDYLTLESIGELLSQQYILCRTTYNNNKLVFGQIDNNISYFLLRAIHNFYIFSTISSTTYRELVRTEPWLSYWRIYKERMFDSSNGVLLSIDQRHLILYSKMYDSVYESAEEPPQGIIDDDDALDGWFLVQKRKREADKGDKTINNMTNIPSDAQEVFIPAKNIEDIKRIENLNSPQSKFVKAQRKATIDKLGVVKESELLDRKMEISQKALEQFRGRHG